MDTSSPVHMAFSTNGLSVSIARGERLLMYNVNREEPEEINDLMIGWCLINIHVFLTGL